jgi:indole-3-glycerol phosphate synthase
MMRKMLVFILVLGLASAANAFIITVDGQTGESFEVDVTATINVVSEDASSWLGYLIVEEGGAGSLENVSILDAAGNNASAGPYMKPAGAPVLNFLHQ